MAQDTPNYEDNLREEVSEAARWNEKIETAADKHLMNRLYEKSSNEAQEAVKIAFDNGVSETEIRKIARKEYQNVFEEDIDPQKYKAFMQVIFKPLNDAFAAAQEKKQEEEVVLSEDPAEEPDAEASTAQAVEADAIDDSASTVARPTFETDDSADGEVAETTHEETAVAKPVVADAVPDTVSSSEPEGVDLTTGDSSFLSLKGVGYFYSNYEDYSAAVLKDVAKLESDWGDKKKKGEHIPGLLGSGSVEYARLKSGFLESFKGAEPDFSSIRGKLEDTEFQNQFEPAKKLNMDTFEGHEKYEALMNTIPVREFDKETGDLSEKAQDYEKSVKAGYEGSFDNYMGRIPRSGAEKMISIIAEWISKLKKVFGDMDLPLFGKLFQNNESTGEGKKTFMEGLEATTAELEATEAKKVNVEAWKNPTPEQRTALAEVQTMVAVKTEDVHPDKMEEKFGTEQVKRLFDFLNTEKANGNLVRPVSKENFDDLIDSDFEITESGILLEGVSLENWTDDALQNLLGTSELAEDFSVDEALQAKLEAHLSPDALNNMEHIPGLWTKGLEGKLVFGNNLQEFFREVSDDFWRGYQFTKKDLENFAKVQKNGEIEGFSKETKGNMLSSDYQIIEADGTMKQIDFDDESSEDKMTFEVKGSDWVSNRRFRDVENFARWMEHSKQKTSSRNNTIMTAALLSNPITGFIPVYKGIKNFFKKDKEE